MEVGNQAGSHKAKMAKRRKPTASSIKARKEKVDAVIAEDRTTMKQIAEIRRETKLQAAQ